jgi:hypothetical protein
MQVDQRYFKRELAKQQRILNKLSGVEVGRAQAAALNKTAKKIKTVSVRAVASKTAIKQKLIRPKLKITNANSKRMVTNINVKTKGIPLIHLNPKVVPGGIQAGKYLVPDGFIATTTSTAKGKGRKSPNEALIGKQHVFRRKGSGRYGLLMQEVTIRPVITREVKSTANAAMQHDAAKFLMHEYKYRVLKKAGQIK